MSELKGHEFDWATMKVALEGLSYLDIPRLNIRTREEARRFLLAYGYDVQDPHVREEIWRIYFESVTFLRGQVLNPGERIPEELFKRSTSTEIERLLMLASSSVEESRWACAILRVMHIISHLDNDVRLENFNHARTQIFDRFDDYIQASGLRRWKFGKGTQGVRLVRYIKKERKDRNSTLIKLLSKPHAFVEEIYDRIGFRFVTETRLDGFRLMNLMFELGVVSVPNIHPGRSLNMMLPFETFQQTIVSTREHLKSGRLSYRNALRRIQRLEEMNPDMAASALRNPFSSRFYRAVQFTCRQLITAPDPTATFWQGVRKELADLEGFNEALRKVPILLREKKTFYYPFEIQIMDKASYVESIGGRSRHREYKERQRQMARSRVLRDLV
jgi:uncharacterized protein (TIGR04562 family)